MATRMCQDYRVLKGRKEIPAHVVRDNSVLQTKHVQGRDLQGSVVEYIVLLTRAAETSDEDGKTEAELWFKFLLLKRAQHGHESSSLAKAQDAVKWTLGLDSFSHNRHAVVQPQTFFALLLGIETSSLDVRKPPTPGVLISFRT